MSNRFGDDYNKMNLARPIFICGDCKEHLTTKSLEQNICEYCEAKICPCSCHIENCKTCEDCNENHEGQ